MFRNVVVAEEAVQQDVGSKPAETSTLFDVGNPVIQVELLRASCSEVVSGRILRLEDQATYSVHPKFQCHQSLLQEEARVQGSSRIGNRIEGLVCAACRTDPAAVLRWKLLQNDRHSAFIFSPCRTLSCHRTKDQSLLAEPC